MSMQICFLNMETRKSTQLLKASSLPLFKKQAKGCVLWGYMLAMPWQLPRM